MFHRLKECLRRYLPVSQQKYDAEIQQVKEMLQQQQKNLMNLGKTEKMLAQLQDEVHQLCESAESTKNSFTKIQEREENLQKTAAQIETTAQRLVSYSKENIRAANEGVWGQIFNNTIANSQWLQDKTFSPGRWAVGYPDLYVIYRLLNEVRPKQILEIGLGQSTRMIAQYAAAFSDVEHTVVEHDSAWIQFFCNSFSLPQNTKIVQLEREMVSYKNAEEVRVFKGFHDMFQGKTFDFIMVDAPLGSDMKQFSRIDALSLMPEGLAENFAILVDDAERVGETHTIAEMEDILKKNNIAYKMGRYRGRNDCVILCSPQQGFLCSL